MITRWTQTRHFRSAFKRYIDLYQQVGERDGHYWRTEELQMEKELRQEIEEQGFLLRRVYFSLDGISDPEDIWVLVYAPKKQASEDYLPSHR
jgi:hypothetical protein